MGSGGIFYLGLGGGEFGDGLLFLLLQRGELDDNGIDRNGEILLAPMKVKSC
jgi:hypothetical protein